MVLEDNICKIRFYKINVLFCVRLLTFCIYYVILEKTEVIYMSVTNATNFRKNVYKYLDNAIYNNDPVIVTTKSGNAVIMNEEDYRSLMETLYLYSIPGMKESIEEGINTPFEECREFNWREELK